ncbi:hypothetical protein ABL78_8119 [Leptomonas seymouri]|uniref:MINDY4 N-terminal dimerisation domain-containing protein n=1 Tax=Leptomonas seymouri TaxID=5684 RepID=A0A0N0P2E7_LEPSE|nr:hypothetical protein ABL78_8119 [Leptomonas seymouri]|eukprot:KPI82866.1 hypothetical protein ABL78_8119 [Leptomonas seymouri]
MTHATPSGSEKERAARLIASLSSTEQSELLAQALLREFMHRRGLHETLKAFDTESPRDERTISSRAVMRHLLNIPVEGRPSRLQPSVSASTGKALPPTFMEELCSYRLTKRSYTRPAVKLRDEAPAAAAEDPSDSEMRVLREAVAAHRSAKAACKQKQRRYEEMLAEQESYSRRKDAHRLKKRNRRNAEKHRHGSEAETQRRRDEDSEGERSDDSDTDSDNSGADQDLQGGRLSKALRDQFSVSRSRATKGSRQRQGSAETSLSGATGTGWQPPGLSAVNAASADAPLDSGATDSPHHLHSRNGQQQQQHSLGWTPAAYNDSEKDDPFGSGASSQQALMARVRAESRHWTSNDSNSHSCEGSGHTTPKKRNSGDDGVDGAAPGQPSPLAALSGVPRGVAPGSGEGPSLRPVTALGALGGNTRLSTAPSGYNMNAMAMGGGGGGGRTTIAPQASTEEDAARRESSAAAPDGLAATPYRYGFPPPPSSALAPSIMVKHTDAARREATGPLSSSALALGDLAASAEGGVHSYGRAALPRSGDSTPSPSAGRSTREIRSPSPNTSPAAVAAGDVAPLSFHTPSRSVSNSGGGNSGLRHGIGFRTSVSAEGTHPASAGGAVLDGDGARHSRRERRVKLLID